MHVALLDSDVDDLPLDLARREWKVADRTEDHGWIRLAQYQGLSTYVCVTRDDGVVGGGDTLRDAAEARFVPGEHRRGRDRQAASATSAEHHLVTVTPLWPDVQTVVGIFSSREEAKAAADPTNEWPDRYAVETWKGTERIG